MQKISTLIFLLILFCTNAFGQIPTLDWALTLGNSDYDYLDNMKVDGSGNVFYSGNFTDSIDFDPGPGVSKLYASNGVMYIVKLDVNRNFIWAKQLKTYILQGTTLTLQISIQDLDFSLEIQYMVEVSS